MSCLGLNGGRPFWSFYSFANFSRVKPVSAVLREAGGASSESEEPLIIGGSFDSEHAKGGRGLVKQLSVSDLVFYGVGSTVGAGIYSLIGPGLKEAGEWCGGASCPVGTRCIRSHPAAVAVCCAVAVCADSIRTITRCYRGLYGAAARGGAPALANRVHRSVTRLCVLLLLCYAVLSGPALVLSFLLGAISCIFTGLAYSEFAARIPVAGSAYIVRRLPRGVHLHVLVCH
jgi:hypothetical protein